MSHNNTKSEDESSFTSPPDYPLPNPEPSVPSLDQPDPGVFHHNPTKPQPAAKSFTTTSHPDNHPEINLL